MSTPHRILIVEDDPAMQATLSQALDSDLYTIFMASNYKEGEQHFASVDPDVVLLDLNLPDRSGAELFDLLKKQNDEIAIIILTAFPELRGAISLIKAGAFDYLIKPFDLAELKIAIRKGLEIKNLRNEVTRLKRREGQPPGLSSIIGESDATRRLREDILKIAEAGSSTVLILGESGTGKEIVANAIHSHSPRAGGPLAAINCAAIPDNLVESELFGHEKGAFTNATQTVKGVFELASGGSLFLDEIAELPVSTQPKLLRALELRKIKRIGGSREIPIDIRLISATNKNLSEVVGQGKFREDLFYRLNVFPLQILPLRERVEDIRPLLQFFTADIPKSIGLPEIEFTTAALHHLERYAWPGNVREMRNLVERLMIVNGKANGPTLVDAHQLPEEIRAGQQESSAESDAPRVETLAEMERRHIKGMMGAFDGNKSEVSRRLGISRNTLKEKLRRHGIER